METTGLTTVELGRTGLQITRVGLGAWAIGGAGWWHAWGAQDDEESIATIRRGFELGINWVDTAPIYGLGHSEEVVGRALEGLDPRPYVFTKASLLDGGDNSVRHNLKRDSLLREVEASLTRLRVDAIDLYQVHWPDPDEDVEEAWTTFAELKEQGLVRHIGVSNFDVAQLRRAQAIAPVETLQPPYSLLERDVEDEILPFAQSEGIGVIVYSPMASGLLSGAMTAERIAALPDDDWRKHDARFQEPAALAPPGPGRAPAGGRRAPRHDRRGDRGGVDAAPPGGGRLDRRLPPPRPGRAAGGRRGTSSSPTRTSPPSPAA